MVPPEFVDRCVRAHFERTPIDRSIRKMPPDATRREDAGKNSERESKYDGRDEPDSIHSGRLCFHVSAPA
jgi:hypothetical protein